MKKGIFAIAVLVVFIACPFYCSGEENAVTVGYGFGMFNAGSKIGKLRGDNGNYYFYQLAFAREKRLIKNLCLLMEPFATYVSDPQNGLDAGMMLSLKYYFGKDSKNSFFATLGTGAAYTTILFEEQGTHLLLILQGGVGYRWNNYFIENRFRHYSNGGIERPNRSVNANIVNIGMYF